MKQLVLTFACCFLLGSLLMAQPKPTKTVITPTNRSGKLSSEAQKKLSDTKLAHQFYARGEYEKAASLYKKIMDSDGSNNHIYGNYYKCLLQLDRFIEAEQLLKQRMAKKANDARLVIDLGMLYKAQDKDEQAKQQFDKALSMVKTSNVSAIAHAFTSAEELDYAIQAYEKGIDESKGKNNFSQQLAYIYKRKGDVPNMIKYYLNHAAKVPGYVQTVKNAFVKVVDEEENMEELQTQLYERIQENPDKQVYYDLLTWSFIQLKDFEEAFLQAKALDKRFKEPGYRLLELAKLASLEKKYDTAIEALEYVVEKKEKNPSLITKAKVQLLEYRKIKITEMGEYTFEDLTKLRDQYEEFLEKNGKKPETVTTMRDLSRFYAYYIHDLGKAINLMQEVVSMKQVSESIRAKSKLDLGDFYLMKNEVWEATLLYSQVDKAFKDDILGEDARFRNAQLSYYNGDFVWAQAQLDVLKSSTSELIANDALELSVFITDNMGLDTTMTPMKMFARGELYLRQNKADQAFMVFDSLNRFFQDHSLHDDILFTKAEHFTKVRDYQQAIALLEDIQANFKEDILADDATFLAAEIYEQQLDDKAKAMELYKSMLIDFPGSLYIVEARKRFRRLRGDGT